MVARLAALPPTVVAVARAALVLALLLAAGRLFLPPFPFGTFGAPLPWLGLACALGFVLARRGALLLAALYVPLCLLGRWYTLATGPNSLLDERDGAVWVVYLGWFGLVLGLVGLALGLCLRWALAALLATARPLPPRAAERLLLAGALALALGAAALDAGRGGGLVRRPWPLEAHRFGAAEVRAAAARFPFAVYGAPPGAGAPIDIRRGAAGPRGPETIILQYCPRACAADGRVDVSSGPPGLAPTAAVLGEVEAAGVTWQETTWPWASPYSASADLGDAYVWITAASQADFARVVAGLRRVNR